MKQIRFFAIVLAVVLAASCNKSENMATGTGDVLIVSKQSGANVVYGISMYAYTFSSFKSVTVTSSADASKTYTLKANKGYNTNFYYEMPESEYTTTKPAASIYSFTATFTNGIVQTFQDALTDKVLPLPTVGKCEYNTSARELEVEWALLPDANNYSVNILDGTTLVFGSVLLSDKVNSYAVSAAGGGWAQGFTPVSGKTYTVRVFAYMFETPGDLYNIQSTSITEKTVVWGN